MTTFPTRARTDADGTLRVSIPTGIADAEVEVVVVVEERKLNAPGGEQTQPPRSLESLCGALADFDLERAAQGDYEVREPFD